MEIEVWDFEAVTNYHDSYILNRKFTILNLRL